MGRGFTIHPFTLILYVFSTAASRPEGTIFPYHSVTYLLYIRNCIGVPRLVFVVAIVVVFYFLGQKTILKDDDDYESDSEKATPLNSYKHSKK